MCKKSAMSLGLRIMLALVALLCVLVTPGWSAENRPKRQKLLRPTPSGDRQVIRNKAAFELAQQVDQLGDPVLTVQSWHHFLINHEWAVQAAAAKERKEYWTGKVAEMRKTNPGLLYPAAPALEEPNSAELGKDFELGHRLDGTKNPALAHEGWRWFLTRHNTLVEGAFARDRMKFWKPHLKGKVWDPALMNDRFSPNVSPVVIVPAEETRPTAAKNAPKPKEQDGRFILFFDGTVLDTGSNLLWAHLQAGNDVNWQQAKEACMTFGAGGYKDWRMPRTEELENLKETGSGIYGVTKLIQLDNCCVWADNSESGGNRAAYNFFFGRVDWVAPGTSFTYVALPVRTYDGPPIDTDGSALKGKP